MNAAIYCRVSTDDQEKEGTSLQTQMQSCIDYCHEKGYEVTQRFSEAYSGLTLDRPKLRELQELTRAGYIEADNRSAGKHEGVRPRYPGRLPARLAGTSPG